MPLTAMPGSRLASPGALIEDIAARWADQRVSVLVTALCLLLVACLAALTLAALVNNSSGHAWIKEHRPISFIFPAKGTRTESAWWVVLQREHPDLYRRVTCYLSDGTRVRGWLHNFNPGAAETEDREVTLAAPIRITGGDGAHRHIKSGFITVSARQIQFLHVDYYPSPGESTAPRGQTHQ